MSQNTHQETPYRYASASATNGNGNGRGADRSSQSQRQLGTAFLSSTLGSTIWGSTPSSSVLPSKDSIGSKGSPKEDHSEVANMESWRKWSNETSQPRDASSSTSPERPRNAIGPNIPNPSPFFRLAQTSTDQRAPTKGNAGWNSPAFETPPSSTSRLTQRPYVDSNEEAVEPPSQHGLSFGPLQRRQNTSIRNDMESIGQRFSSELSSSSGPSAPNTFQFDPSSQPWVFQQRNGQDARPQSGHGNTSDRRLPNSNGHPENRGHLGQTSLMESTAHHSFPPPPVHLQDVAVSPSRGRSVAPQPPFHQYGPTSFDTSFANSAQQFIALYPHNSNSRISPFPHMHQAGHHTTGPGRNPHMSPDYRIEDPRSDKLKEFLATYKNRRWELRDIYGHMVEFAGDSNASRCIQDRLATANNEERDRVFQELLSNIFPLSRDRAGNYVVQKLFEHGSQIQKKLVVNGLKTKIQILTLDSYGCRVVQKALEHVLEDQQVELVEELKSDVMTTIKDGNGNHVIQQALQHVHVRHLDFIFRSLHGRLKELCSHTYACRVVQKAIDRASEPDRAMIVEEVLPHARELANDQFGNYVIGHIIRMKRPEYTTRIVNSILADVVALSKQKYASNVVELCLVMGSPEDRRRIEKQMTTPDADGGLPLQTIVVDQFGNYVVNKLLDHTTDRPAFVQILRPTLVWALGYLGDHPERAKGAGRGVKDMMSKINAEQTAPSTRRSSTAPTSPLQLEVTSATPTPNLTMEPNSPSSSPPSTTDSAADEPIAETLKASTDSTEGLTYGTVVRLEDS